MILIKLTQKIEYIYQLYYQNLISKLNLNNVPCPICGSTHAIHVEGMTPFTSITFDFVLLIIFPHRYHSFLLIFCLPFVCNQI